MEAKLISVLIGYIFGCFLTAEIVARKRTGKSASELGKTGNPGMANITASLGILPGIITLIGDLGKCALAGLLSWYLFSDAGWIIVLYAGLGCTLGHNFPFWRKFRGGKGVATSSMAIVLYSFIPGLCANIIGLLVVLFSGYLCIGGPCIPLSYTIIMLTMGDQEAAIISVILTALSLIGHGGSIRGIRDGNTEKTNLLGKLRSKKE